MLRITKVGASRAEATLKLEGRLVAEWIPAFETICRQTLAEHVCVHLDFAHVHRVDREGGLALAALACARLDIVDCPPLIRGQLEGQLQARPRGPQLVFCDSPGTEPQRGQGPV